MDTIENLNKEVKQPVKAIVIGLFTSLVVMTIITSIFGISVLIFKGVDLTDEALMVSTLSNSPAVLAVDFVLTIGILYFAGLQVGKRTAEEAGKYGL